MSKVTYIVSAFSRPDLLPVCLFSLKAQTDPEFEVIVTDNAPDKATQEKHRIVVSILNDKRFRYIATASKIKVSDCYWSAEYAAKLATGDGLCFPCDDCYYVPGFQRRILSVAERYGWGLVMCDVVYCYNTGRYDVMAMKPSMNISAKSAFMVKRELFSGFHAKPQRPEPCAADCALIAELVKSGVSHGVVQDVMVVHN